nr:PBECR2 nuclease fold domain-containing protein [Ruminococcus bromii]
MAVICVYLVGKIDIEIYNCITKDITTDEVIITDKQIDHIKNRHPNDYELFNKYFEKIVEQPDYIIEANKPFTALILKEIQIDNKKFKTVVRLATSNDTPSYKNSIITFMKIDDREWNRILKNKKILYKSE